MLALEKPVWLEKTRLTSSEVWAAAASKTWHHSGSPLFTYSIKKKTEGNSAHRVPALQAFTLPAELTRRHNDIMEENKILPPQTWSLDISFLLSFGKLPRIKPKNIKHNDWVTKTKEGNLNFGRSTRNSVTLPVNKAAFALISSRELLKKDTQPMT